MNINIKKANEIILKLKHHLVANKIFEFNIENFFEIEDIDEQEFYTLFPDKISSMCLLYFRNIYELTIKKNKSKLEAEKSISKKVKLILKYNIFLLNEDKELSIFFISFITARLNLANKISFYFSDMVWKELKDKSIDFNFYTKRIILYKIYLASLYYWRRTLSLPCTNMFIDREISSIKILGKVKSFKNKFVENLSSLDLLKYLDFKHK
tara:strand:- start:336 stop:965 length:630 start_codon:yes stop_codon:yes gene_type:complete